MANEARKKSMMSWLVALLLATPLHAQQPPAATAQGDAPRGGAPVMVGGKPMHVSADRSLRDLKNNRLELFGNVYVRRPQELLTSDYAVLDLNTERIVAEGNVAYFTSATVIYGSKMDFNYITGTGIIENGRVENEQYSLSGDLLERLGEDDFAAERGDYTTCKDCPGAWKIHGKHIRLTLEGYARVSHMLIKINDSPLFYFPYLIIPVKTRRQSGFLFPKFRTGSIHGFQYIQPFFWAISRSQDMTFGFGKLTARGYKGELQHRYSLGSRSFGQTDGFFLQDRTFIEPYQSRWAVNATHFLSLPGDVDFKLHWIDATDRDYPRFFPDDIPGSGEPALVSEASLSKTSRDLSAWTSVKRIKRLLRRDLVGFDHQQVQEVPSLTLAANDHPFFRKVPLYWGINFNYKRFWRQGADEDILPGPEPQGVDLNFTPGRDPLRRAQRFMLMPEVYYTARAGEFLDFTPSVQYRSFFYVFDRDNIPVARRGFLVASARTGTNLERIYGGVVKHRLRPTLTYNIIPSIQDDRNHPFSRQLAFGKSNVLEGQPGRQFDDFDIVPVSFEDTPQYFTPIGHSLTYEIHNHFILKSFGDDGTSVIPDNRQGDKSIIRLPATTVPTYRKVVDLSLGQTVNFIELRKNMDERPLTRAYAIGSATLNNVRNNSEVYYYPYSRAFQISTAWTYLFANFRKRLLRYERSISFGYSRNKVTSQAESVSAGFAWSFNDYLSIAMSRALDLSTGRVVSTTGQIIYQSPSQCWQVMLNASKTIDRQWEVSPNLVINLAGTGFTSFTDPNSAGNVGGTAAR